MEFSFLQCATLQAVKGAYSPVTNREIYDSQITATDTEAKLLVEYFKRSSGIQPAEKSRPSSLKYASPSSPIS